MPPSVVNKALVGAAGLVGAGVLAWQTQFPWIKYDLQFLMVGKKLQKAMEEAVTTFVIDRFEGFVAKHPLKTMVIFEDCLYTYDFMDQQANRVANLMRHLGLRCGDTVAMMIHNEPAFIWTFLGLQKLGVGAALINFNLRSKQLSFCIQSAEPKALIVGAGTDLLQAVSDLLTDLKGLPVLVQGLTVGEAPLGMQDLDMMMVNALPVRPDPSLRSEMTNETVAAYLYTSGTTGLPKPAYVNQFKMKLFTCILQMVDMGPEDTVYTVIPLYHVSGFGAGLCSILNKGSSMVLRRTFSATHFWSDCRKYNVTIAQYIGELFRYLLALPKHELDSVHPVRAAVGNGLRKDIFEEVLKRFKIPLVLEMFGATEGVSVLFNVSNKPGAIGRMSPFLDLLDPYPKVLVKFDHSSAMPVRDKNGCCIKVKPGEPGLFLSQVPDIYLTRGDLTVYKASTEANEKKLVRNAFQEGDLYFNYGDALYLDQDYFLYFYDRIGDTFRWKGENVSTTEVANVISAPTFIDDANVYGVTIPGHEGRAGMAALSLNEGEKITPERLKQVYKVCEDGLPSYARPLFLRILPEAVLTGTFKQRKVELAQEGYDLTKVKDDLYYPDFKAKTYSPLTPGGLASFLQSRL